MNSFFKVSLGTITALVMTGCYTPYEYKSVAVDSFQYKDVAHRVSPDTEIVLTLERAKELALENNPDFRSTEYAMKAAWARYQQSLASYYPTLYITSGLNFSQSNVTQQSSFSTHLGDSRSRTATATLNTEYLIFNGLIRKMNSLSAQHTAKSSDAAFEDAKRLLVKSIEIQYNQIRLINENIRIAKTDKLFQEKLLIESEMKYRAGSVSQSSVLNFKVRVNAADNRLVQEHYDLINARDILAELMGLTQGTLLDSINYSILDENHGVVLANVNIYLDTALNNRPDLKQYREALKSAEYSLYAKYGSFWPVVKGSGSVGVASADVNNDSATDTRKGTRDYNYGVNMSWDLFTGGSRRNAVDEAKALVAQNESKLESKWINVVQEVRNSFNTFLQREEQYIILKRTQELQRKNRDLVEIEYRSGSSELTRLNEAQRDLIASETEKISALINLYNAKAQLESAINGNL